MRVFLDANVLFSAADKESATRKLVEGIAAFGEAVTSPHAWEEARRNLASKRPNLLGELDQLRGLVRLSNAFRRPKPIDLPPEDIPIIAGAMGSECEYLCTSDKKHFGKWYGKKVENVGVVSSAMLADLLFKAGWRS